MSDSFDPYHQWLGIRDKDRPPNHYRLLGLDLFENDLDVISNAADRQMSHIRTYQSGKRAQFSHQILNELAQAKICLHHEDKKAEYDRQLREKLGSQSGLTEPPHRPSPKTPPKLPPSGPVSTPKPETSPQTATPPPTLAREASPLPATPAPISDTASGSTSATTPAAPSSRTTLPPRPSVSFKKPVIRSVFPFADKATSKPQQASESPPARPPSRPTSVPRAKDPDSWQPTAVPADSAKTDFGLDEEEKWPNKPIYIGLGGGILALIVILILIGSPNDTNKSRLTKKSTNTKSPKSPKKTPPIKPFPKKPTFNLKPWPGNAPKLVLAWKRHDRQSTGKVKLLHPKGQARFDSEGYMRLRRGYFESNGGGRALAPACIRSNELGIELTFLTNDSKQIGLARIITLSSGANTRNFTLGQEGDKLIFRLRTTRTGTNGDKPETQLCKFTVGQRHHLVVTYRPGRLVCYLDGKNVLSSTKVQGDFSNWSRSEKLIFGDELVVNRDWNGILERVALYSRFIDEDEAIERFELVRPDLR